MSHRLPIGCDNANSGLNDHRETPRLISLSGKYWPVGAIMVRLAPKTARREAWASSPAVAAGAPCSSTESRRRISLKPVRVICPELSPTLPDTSAHEIWQYRCNLCSFAKQIERMRKKNRWCIYRRFQVLNGQSWIGNYSSMRVPKSCSQNTHIYRYPCISARIEILSPRYFCNP